MAQYDRKGDQTKCPVCGWRIDSAAYRCPKCRVYFCYKCRVQLRRNDLQFECADQTCGCYGKLLCASCSPPLPVQQPTTRTEAGWGCGLAILSAVAAGATYLATSVGVAMAVGIVVFLVAARVVVARGGHVFPQDVPSTFVADARSCIQCKHPVKHVAGREW